MFWGLWSVNVMVIAGGSLSYEKIRGVRLKWEKAQLRYGAAAKLKSRYSSALSISCR